MEPHLGRQRPVGWVPTDEEIETHRLDPEVVAELRAEAGCPQLRPVLLKGSQLRPLGLPPLPAVQDAVVQLGLFDEADGSGGRLGALGLGATVAAGDVGDPLRAELQARGGGQNSSGLWFSGVAGPWLSEWDRTVFQGCQPNYHMKQGKGGQWQLRAVLLVPVPGHSSPLLATAVTARSNLALSASAANVLLFPDTAGHTPRHVPGRVRTALGHSARPWL
ncbi:hypothetical protein [Streptomyces sp. NPDC002205]|uniref:hypothetical protein n=1 Tax=Streptomyces sp. NPDC002205 TaxID=3154411 RepID=UPI00332AC633